MDHIIAAPAEPRSDADRRLHDWRAALRGARYPFAPYRLPARPPAPAPDPEEARVFGRRHSFDDLRPVVYLGTSRREKGVIEAYRALASSDFQFVVSGGEHIPEVPVRRLDLSVRDYLLLLARADV